MSLFAPLRGLRPPPDRAAEVAELPYDVMNRDEALAMAESRPHSFLHVSRPDIDLPPGARSDSPEALALARAAFDRLQRDGLLVRDADPGYHAYRLTRDGQAQTGVVGVADVAGAGAVTPRTALTRPTNPTARTEPTTTRIPRRPRTRATTTAPPIPTPGWTRPTWC